MANDALDKIQDTAESNKLSVAKAAQTDDLKAKRTESDALIKRYALLGTASGLIPVFGLDVAASTALQTKMIKDLADIYEFDIDDQILRTAITTGVTALVGRVLTAAAGMLAGTISPLKMFVNGATKAAVSGFLTLEVGKLYQSKMELGQNPADITIMSIADHIIAQIKEGKWDASKLSLTNQLGALVKG
ncbi:DUF697 domain-containing protein [Neolewinella antarctica]|uniref:Uncharacterized protein (DUF697 family) n=1 Tax=Neolewinella antarctica TaxID=442734 RepID=A0ABX0X9U5_9BACT|nr:DUF697 domain-containing protein [Neolewinella antarctica]NJC26041.1 uncharacterized protein (DUF697 family) [Neolewinella antarctica]